MNNYQTIDQSKSFEKIYDYQILKNFNNIDENYELRNTKENFTLTQDEITNKKGKIDILDSDPKKSEDKNIYNKYNFPQIKANMIYKIQNKRYS